MANDIIETVNNIERQEYATAKGRAMHAQMQHIFFDKNGNGVGNADIVARVSNLPDLIEFMGPLSQTEVPIAGTIDGKFISRRIDRLYINHDLHRIVVLDYKTDLDKDLFRNKYIEQLKEYHALLKKIYHDYDVKCKILWLNDFTLENII